MGGVERVYLNRARAFKKHGIDVKQDVFFFHDSGGLNNFRHYIKHFLLEDYINVVPEIDEKEYDLIFVCDTPQAFDYIKDTSKIIVECHTPYDDSRVYLPSLPKNIAGVVSPGRTFMDTVVRKEIPGVFADRLSILPNFYIKNGQENIPPTKIWAKTPICYIGRMDALKNTKELLDIFALLRKKLNDDYFLLLVGDVRPHYIDIKEAIKKLKIEDRVAYYRQIPFEKVDDLLTIIRQHRGVFISPSLGESFGLSALEAMANEIPVLLSDIECHKPLVNNEPAFLYRSGNLNEAAKRVTNLFSEYDGLSKKAKQMAEKHCSDSFIEAWGRLVEK